MPQPAPAREVPPPLELLCLQALWALGSGNVASVRQVLAETKPLAYTTVMTILERLARKSLVSRRKAGRAYVYVPEVAQETMQRQALNEFLKAHFSGSRQKLMDFLHHEETAPAPAAALEPLMIPLAAPLPASASEESVSDGPIETALL